MKLINVINKIGLSWHDVFIIFALLETCWWLMYAFVDGADVILRLEEDVNLDYHDFLIIEKIISVIKLCLAFGCLWYGALYQGNSLLLRIYIVIGILMDTTLILSWIVISVEEAWPLSPYNVYGLHYIITFSALRILVYWILYLFISDTYSSPFDTPAVGTANGAVVGIPDYFDTVGRGSNLAFLGKGLTAVFAYYRVEVERAYLISIMWDMVWNLSIIISQELPEAIYDIIFLGIYGSLALNIPTENLAFRFLRVFLGIAGIYLAAKKLRLCLKIWIFIYFGIVFSNLVVFCYNAKTMVLDETAFAIFTLCVVFVASNVGKMFVIFCASRYYRVLKMENASIINDNNNFLTDMDC